jgi:hypothetical protein
MDWLLIAATFVNVIVVMAVVGVLKTYVMPFLKTKYPWLLPVIAAVAGPLVTAAANWISAALGHPIDFSEIVAVLTGVVSVVMYDSVKVAHRKHVLRRR